MVVAGLLAVHAQRMAAGVNNRRCLVVGRRLVSSTGGDGGSIDGFGVNPDPGVPFRDPLRRSFQVQPLRHSAVPVSASLVTTVPGTA